MPVRLLGEIKCSEAVNSLTRLLSASSSSYALEEEICIALGMIGSVQAVPTLVARLQKKDFWQFGKRKETERVRMRAAWALRKFKDKDAENALGKASNDKSDSVALTAKESLEIMRSK